MSQDAVIHRNYVRSIEEVEWTAHAVWRDVPPEIRHALLKRGVTMYVSDVEPHPALGAYSPLQRAIILYYHGLKSAPAYEIERVVLHEIAHACGMGHPEIKAHGL